AVPAGQDLGHRVLAPEAYRPEPIDVLECLPAEHLYPTGHAVRADPLRYASPRVLLNDMSARDAQPGPLGKRPQHLVEVVRLDDDVGVEIADEVVVESVDVAQARPECVHLGGEVSTDATGVVVDEPDPIGGRGVRTHELRRGVDRPVVHDDPADRP